MQDQELAERIAALIDDQEGVLGRRQLYALGFTRWQLRAQLAAQRWQRTGRQTVCVTTGQLTREARWWVAVIETGPRAALDGVSALQAAGVTGLDDEVVHVIAPKSSNPRRSSGVRVHDSRRFRESDVVTAGVRRVGPAVAGVHAALWARTDRQAAFFLVLLVQQRIVTPQHLEEALTSVRRSSRRRLLAAVVADLRHGVQSINELDVTRALRRRGLPEPSRQVLVTLPSGRVYLDLEWGQWGVHLEIDGAQHDAPDARVQDVLRDLDLAATGRVTVRLPMLAFRVDEAAVLDRIETLLMARGWQRRRRASA